MSQEPEPDRVYTVNVSLNNGQGVPGELIVYEEAPANPDEVLLILRLPSQEWSASAETLFDALSEIRRQLEPMDGRIASYGASRNVYPSPMIRSMGNGDKAYKLSMGKPATSADLVSIFATGPDVDPVSVSEQERYYAEWIRSLR